MTCVQMPELSNAAGTIRAAPRKPGILVDDMGMILTLLKFALEPHGFTVWLAVGGDDAIDVYRRNRDEIDVVLLDVQMPGLDGPRTLAALQQQNPDVLACFMTGDAGNYAREDLLGCGAAHVFNKPFSATEVARSVHALLLSAGDADRFSWLRRRLPCER